MLGSMKSKLPMSSLPTYWTYKIIECYRPCQYRIVCVVCSHSMCCKLRTIAPTRVTRVTFYGLAHPGLDFSCQRGLESL